MNISLAPEILFNIGPLPVTNSLLWGSFLVLALMLFFVIIAKRMKDVPGPMQNITELVLEVGYDFVHSITGDEKKTKRVFPFVFTIFVFTFVANMIVYIPGQSAISLLKEGDVSVPLFRAAIADYGMVLMLTILSIVTTQVVAIIVNGPFGYIGQFINLSGLYGFFKKLMKGKLDFGMLASGFFDIFMGIMDLVGELAKIVSLSFRLFGNIFAGEVLTIVMLSLAAFIVPLPFMLLGLLSATVQAFVFSVLTLIYITMASELEVEEKTEQVAA